MTKKSASKKSPALLETTAEANHIDGGTMRPLEMRCIYRIGDENSYAWQVNLSRVSPKRRYSKRFSDSRYGDDEKKSLAAAQVWRDEMERRHPRQSKYEATTHRGANNRSGIPGVGRQVTRHRHSDGREVIRAKWVATSPSWAKTQRTRAFSVNKYGEDEAYRRAVATRTAFLAEAERMSEGLLPVITAQVVRKPPPEMRNICRLEGKKGASWRVSIKRFTLEGRRIKSFSDADYGGSAGALAAAQAWRDDIERQYPRLTKKDLAVLRRESNASGRTGVSRADQLVSNLDGREYIATYWVAKTPTALKSRRSLHFRTDKYGEQEAYRLAVEARRAFEELLDDT